MYELLWKIHIEVVYYDILNTQNINLRYCWSYGKISLYSFECIMKIENIICMKINASNY